MGRGTNLLESATMRNCVYKPIWIILPIIFFSFSYASAQQKQITSKKAEFYESLGHAYLEKRQYAKAILFFNKALKMNPADAYGYHDRGRAYGEQGQYDVAISDYTKALEIDPGYADAYFNRGLAYHAKGQYDQAIFDYTRALEIDPADAGTYYARGFTYYFKKEYEKSWADVKKAQSLGYSIHPKFLDDLLNASGKQRQTRSKMLSPS
jgi:tetratricopeptide (TPR) repeat protein